MLVFDLQISDAVLDSFELYGLVRLFERKFFDEEKTRGIFHEYADMPYKKIVRLSFYRLEPARKVA